MARLKTPPGWTSNGALPRVDIDNATPEALKLLDEDLLQLTDPSGAYTLDVGWYPAGDKSGRYIGQLIKSDEWDSPIEQVETTYQSIVQKWLNSRIADVQLKLGEFGAFTKRVGLFVYPNIRMGNRAQRRAANRSQPKPKVIPTFLSRRPTAPNQTPSTSALRTLHANTSTALAVQLGAELRL